MKKLFLFLFCIGSGLLLFSGQGQAAEKERVLLVYDSLNLADSGEKKVDSIQRLLTSMDIQVVPNSLLAFLSRL